MDIKPTIFKYNAFVYTWKKIVNTSLQNKVEVLLHKNCADTKKSVLFYSYVLVQ